MNFPREVGAPRKVVYGRQEYLDYINLYNGKKKSIYNSIYHFDIVNYKPEYDSAVLTCLFFDFDDKDCDSYKEIKKLHDYCFGKNIQHKLVMSGRGYHCYIITETYRANNTRDTIYNAQHFFIDMLDLDVDPHVIGNPAQLSRVINTWNGKWEGDGDRFCIPITKEQFDKGDDYIKQLSNKQNFVNNIICDNKFILNNYDFAINSFENDSSIKPVDIKLENTNIPFPPCLVNIIKRGNMRWKERYLLILYMKEMGYSITNAYEILNTVCSSKTFNHCVNEEKQLQYLYERNDLTFPCCNKINMDGYCPGKCTQFDKVVYK